MRKEKIAGHQTFLWVVESEIDMAPPQWGRPLRLGDVRSIAYAFDADKFGALFVWYRPDREPHHHRYTVIDGQHRLAAVRMMEGYRDQRVPCVLYEGLTMETAAELSLGLQDRRNLHALDRFRGELAAHERCAVEVDKVCRALDLELVYAAAASSTRRLSAVNQLERTWETLGVPGLERVLRVCDAAWGGTSAGFARPVLKLVSILVAAHNGELNDAYLAEVLGSRSPGEWVAGPARRPLTSIAQDVIMEYNKRRRGSTRVAELTPSEYMLAAKRPPIRTMRGPIEGVTTTSAAGTRRRYHPNPRVEGEQQHDD
jgi:hypothetical protein